MQSLLKLSLAGLALGKTPFDGFTKVENKLTDYIHPWDGTWPMLEMGLNYKISGTYEGYHWAEDVSTRVEDYDN